ncbi:hypothetical protein G3489_23985, partial [Shewanella baltica]|uniref:hypothetical protein n=1 Tax=Shewanella baltica TaxID=62322 RepID=UPI00217ED11F
MNHISQKGYGSLLLITLVALLSLGGGYYYESRISQPESANETYETTAEELSQISRALISFYKDTNSWPTSLNQLVSSGYFKGDPKRCGGGVQSPFCTTIFGSQNGDSYTLSTNLLHKSVAEAVANQISGGIASGTTVIATIKRPYQSELYSDYLQRVSNPDKPERTRLEVAVDVNENDLLNIRALDATAATIDTANIKTAKVDRIEAQQIALGANSISYSGTRLNL